MALSEVEGPEAQRGSRGIVLEALGLLDAGTDAWGALAALDGCRAAVVLDAVRRGAAPGTLHRAALDDLEHEGLGLSLHGVTLLDLLRVEALWGRGPDEVLVLGIEPGRVEPGIGLSAECRTALPRLVAAALAELARLCRAAPCALEGRPCS